MFHVVPMIVSDVPGKLWWVLLFPMIGIVVAALPFVVMDATEPSIVTLGLAAYFGYYLIYGNHGIINLARL